MIVTRFRSFRIGAARPTCRSTRSSRRDRATDLLRTGEHASVPLTRTSSKPGWIRSRQDSASVQAPGIDTSPPRLLRSALVPFNLCPGNYHPGVAAGISRLPPRRAVHPSFQSPRPVRGRTALPVGIAGVVCGSARHHQHHRIVGITKSAPARMPVGHLVVIVFSRV